MIRAVAGSTTYKQSFYFIRFPVTQKVVSVAMETDGLCLSSAVQDVLHEQRHAEHGGVGLQSAATTQTAQTQLQTHKHNSELSGGDLQRQREVILSSLIHLSAAAAQCFG